ncbi:Histone-lysine N-methyltransferase SETD1B [Abeliophyllum distichum]|uniref:Histone-lysine N-methyltransferase SETD1B n=1 Tax=Abeliophyllum distichum TaxID=126358 RepID=A0ABD1UET4_9LAMI
MDFDRPHYRTTSTSSSGSTTANTSEILLCLASRLSSSSSMKLSKSILSPGRAARDAPVSLSTSLSRKLRTNGSLKGGASPFFTTTGKKRGCGFENPEPSSPKVTCIGQVRVKTKKKVKQTRSLSRRRSGEISFRKLEQGQSQAVERLPQNEDKICSQTQRYSNGSVNQQQQDCLPHRNQRWVHLPVTICEALRSFGAEFSCLFPCKSSCFSTSEREKEEKRNGSSRGDNGQSSCGAVFARWLVSVNNDEGGRRREIELVVSGGDEEEMRTDLKERISMRSSRRHVLEDIEIKDDKIEEEAGRVSICIPPKNALLLMRCRSDPMKMAALANRFSWDANAAFKQEDADDGGENIDKEIEDNGEQLYVQECEVVDEVDDEIRQLNVGVTIEQEIPIESEMPQNLEEEVEQVQNSGEILYEAERLEREQEPEIHDQLIEEEVESNMSSFEALLDQENTEHYEEDSGTIQQDDAEENLPSNSSSLSAESDDEEEYSVSTEESALYEEASLEKLEETQDEATSLINAHQEIPHEEEEQGSGAESIESESKEEENQEWSSAKELNKEKENPALPECLLLMMCEPKLSMEVSKETWVCSTDFVRWLPQRPLKAANHKPTKEGCERESIKKKLVPDSKPKTISLPPQNRSDNNQRHLHQPPRSSCSLPAATAAASMASMIEQKLVNAVGYEPFVLTRCKSEPMRTAAAKLMPESCFWKNAMRKLEPHRRATFGVGAAGVGF